ncbi:MAG: D-tyrosyl-tRNA(Tyr) deacylase [Verrucomicrobiaceae bacterium]|nr:MAG: D-tyrosyl-tRNA(Tyr) deacylase [Verrucomicrobiaceae bacterium]
MRALVQRVSSASVSIDGQTHASIGPGLLVLLGISESDTAAEIAWLAPKVARLRIFGDEAGAMNRSLADTDGEILLVSQFTLLASTQKGNRPSFLRAARPEQAIPLYESFRDALAAELGKPVSTGVFGADMQIALINDGPVTVWIDSQSRE